MSKDSIRFGGQERDGRFVFELSGGAPAMDFLNTLDERRGARVERLNGYDALVDWALQAGVLSERQANALIKSAKHNPAQAAQVLKEALRLREFLFKAMQTIVAKNGIEKSYLKTLNGWVSKASRQRRLAAGNDVLIWSWGDAGLDPNVMLWRIVESAAETLASGDLRRRLRVCGGTTCAWTFLDFSPKQNRQWCDMSVCGNRAKARRHYQRSKEAAH
jgi:predicted RNA-binding Zn ribbon-like protein